MNLKKGILLIVIMLIVGGSVLYAQNNWNGLNRGTYSCDDLGNGHTIKIELQYYQDGSQKSARKFTQYVGNGVIANGTVSSSSGGRGGTMEVKGDYTATWTFVDSNTFIDQGGKTWRRVSS
jgi:hypothetical protein